MQGLGIKKSLQKFPCPETSRYLWILDKIITIKSFQIDPVSRAEIEDKGLVG